MTRPWCSWCRGTGYVPDGRGDVEPCDFCARGEPCVAVTEDDIEEALLTDEAVAWHAEMSSALLRDQLEASVALPLVLWPGKAA